MPGQPFHFNNILLVYNWIFSKYNLAVDKFYFSVSIQRVEVGNKVRSWQVMTSSPQKIKTETNSGRFDDEMPLTRPNPSVRRLNHHVSRLPPCRWVTSCWCLSCQHYVCSMCVFSCFVSYPYPFLDSWGYFQNYDGMSTCFFRSTLCNC